MAAELLRGLGKWLGAGATYLQHQQFVERLRGMRLEDAKAHLATYVRDMPAAGFNGLKLALTLLAKTNKDPSTSTLLNGLLGSLDAARDHHAPGAADTATASRVLDTPLVQSFQDDATMVYRWYELDEDGRVAALDAHLVDLTPEAFRAFRAHMSQAVEQVAEVIRQHEASEDSACGGFPEDRSARRAADR